MPATQYSYTARPAEDLAEIEALIAAAVAELAATVADEPVIYTAGQFVPPSSGEPFPGRPVMSAGEPTGDWDGYTLSGVEFSHTENQKATMAMFAPASWDSVVISVLGLASSFGSGKVRLGFAGDPANYADLAVAGAFIGPVTFLTPPTWSAGAGAFGDKQFAQFTITRDVSVGGNLAQGFAILAVALTNGG